MSKKTAAKGTVVSRLGNVVDKGKDLGKNAAATVKAAGAKAASHVSRNKAAYIAGGLGAAAGAAGMAAASRRKQSQDE
ncbi:MAG: hypothetical protein LBI05_10075 [Planctomycetaceae bacterium]|nr:hypothetical protein [Planctomycetaceae bacterium]